MNDKLLCFIGSSEISPLFRNLNCDVFSPIGEDETRITLSKILTKYKVIFIDETYSLFVSEIIREQMQNVYPIITIVPSSSHQSTFALEKIDDMVEKALGVKLIFDSKN